MVERFNRNFKLVIHADYASRQDLKEEDDKYVALRKTAS